MQTIWAGMLVAGCASSAGAGADAGADAGAGADVGALQLELTSSASVAHIPAPVTFTAVTDPAATVSWDLGDGNVASGAEVTHTWLGSGEYFVRATATLKGASVTQTLSLDVEPAPCPTTGEASSAGQLLDSRFTEISGVAESAVWPGTLWLIEDAGNDPTLIGIDTAGAVQALFQLPTATARDWEDLALGPDGRLYLADTGDNAPYDRAEVQIAMLPEPDPNADNGDLEVDELEISYADGMHDVEAFAIDPVTGDLWIATKDYGGPSHIYSKPAPHEPDTLTVLEEQAYLDFSVEPLSGGATTGAGFSPLGDLIIIRTYGTTGWIFRVDRSFPVVDAFAGEPCPVALPSEAQSESIAFSADGLGLWSVSEQSDPEVNYTPLVWE